MAGLYALAALLAHAGHDHSVGHGRAIEAQEGCSDPGAHWAAHADTPDLSQLTDDCAACHLRASFAYSPEAGPPTPVASAQHATEPAPADAAPRSVLPISSRGPPRD